MQRSNIRESLARSKPSLALLALALFSLAFGLETLASGSEVSLSIFYLLPIALVSWVFGRAAGITVALACAGVGLMVDPRLGAEDSYVLVAYWNALIRFGLFAVAVLAVAEHHTRRLAVAAARKTARQLHRRDPLTGVANSRGFFDQAEVRVRAAQQSGQTATLVFVDVDGLRAFDDRFGRRSGDALLAEIASGIEQLLRPQDLCGRIGGDEFAILLTGLDPAAARRFGMALQGVFRELQAGNGQPVQASIGIVVHLGRRQEVNDLLQRAEQLMYASKDAGGGQLRLEIVGAEASPGLADWATPAHYFTTGSAGRSEGPMNGTRQHAARNGKRVARFGLGIR